MIDLDIGKRISDLRNARGLTVNGLAYKSGVSRAYLREIESGKYKNPSIDILGALCWALSVSLSEFFKEELDLDDASDSLMKEINKLSQDQKESLRLFLKSMTGE